MFNSQSIRRLEEKLVLNDERRKHRENHSKKLYSPKSRHLFLLCSSYDNCSKKKRRKRSEMERKRRDDDDDDEGKKDKIK